MNRILAGGIAAAIALVVGAAQAQTADKPAAPETGNRPMQTGVSETNGSKPAIVERAENSRPAQATKRVAKKTGKAAKNAGHKTADAMRRTGKSVESHLPDTKASGASADTATRP
ncbi:hypothetical protein [Ramlibacter algicola]|uniref:Cell envelope biogenesis protein TolA n=1 Tax=Ramlibacter algicola TaxID=2795217 RepID=A0A934UQK5_9BURK|nr:hypothetical protein [Ramlibacter algicola]MBK0391916.1 hypothetical protein [Ramlibacter algicola]